MTQLEFDNLLKEINEDKIFASFIKFAGMEQEGNNDYTVGAIQTANALEPIITKLLIKLMPKP